MRKGGRKLLVASLGVAAISYVACGGSCVANLMAVPYDGSADTAKEAGSDTPGDTSQDSARDVFSPLDLVANIVAPSP
jgi:hypothetical protein